MPHSYDQICGAVARGWCAPVNAGKEMDIELATAIAKEVWKLIHMPTAPPYDPRAAVSGRSDPNPGH